MAQGVRARQEAIQASALQAIREQLPKTGRVILHLATGAGKTRAGVRAAKETLDTGRRVLWLTHKHDLVRQAVETFRAEGVTDIGVVAGGKNEHGAAVVVAMVQKACREATLARLAQQEFGLTVTDECHHGPANSYRTVLGRFPEVPRIGLSATIIRSDAKDVTEVFGQPCASLSVAEAIAARIYADPQNLSRVILTRSKIEGLTSASGEYAPSDLDRLVVSAQRNQAIVQSYLRYGRAPLVAAGRVPKAIGFAIDTKHAKILTEAFRAAGVSAEFVVGNTKAVSRAKREEILRRFQETSEIEVLLSCSLLTEGTDIPETNCILMCRPSRSYISYSQALGRGCRFIDGVKEDFIVLDFADACRRGFESCLLSQVTGKAYEPSQIVTEFVDQEDPVVLDERVNVIRSLVDYEATARRGDWYPTSEEWLGACRRLGIWSQAKYLQRYKEDPRLPSSPHKLYFNFRWAQLSGQKPKGYWTREQCAIDAQRFSSLSAWQRASNSAYTVAQQSGWLSEIRAQVFPNARAEDSAGNKAIILELAAKLGRRLTDTLPEEICFARLATNYCQPLASAYDKAFAEKYFQYTSYTDKRVAEKKEQILTKVGLLGRQLSAQVLAEKCLAYAALSYCSSSGNSYDPAFAQTYKQYPTFREWKKQQKTVTAKSTTEGASPVAPANPSSTDGGSNRE
jgi:superfamily II DNA or RNA helicase